MLGLQHDGTHKQPFIILVSCWERERDRTVQIKKGKRFLEIFLTWIPKTPPKEKSLIQMVISRNLWSLKRSCDGNRDPVSSWANPRLFSFIRATKCSVRQRERNCKWPRMISTEPRSSVLWDWTLKATIAKLPVPQTAFINMVGCRKICRISMFTT